MSLQCRFVPRYKCNKHGGLGCLGCKTYNIYCTGYQEGRKAEKNKNEQRK